MSLTGEENETIIEMLSALESIELAYTLYHNSYAIMPNNHENTRLVDVLKDVKPGELVVLKQKFNISHKRRVFLVVRCFTEPITYFEKEGEQLSFLQLFPCWMGEDAELYRWEKASPFYFERLEVKE